MAHHTTLQRVLRFVRLTALQIPLFEMRVWRRMEFRARVFLHPSNGLEVQSNAMQKSSDPETHNRLNKQAQATAKDGVHWRFTNSRRTQSRGQTQRSLRAVHLDLACSFLSWFGCRSRGGTHTCENVEVRRNDNIRLCLPSHKDWSDERNEPRDDHAYIHAKRKLTADMYFRGADVAASVTSVS